MLLEIYEHFRGAQKTHWGFDEAKAFWELANTNRGTTPLTEAFWNGNLPKLLGFDRSGKRRMHLSLASPRLADGTAEPEPCTHKFTH